MSISGARRAHSSPGLPADAHDAGFWGAKVGGTTARSRTRAERLPTTDPPMAHRPPQLMLMMLARRTPNSTPEAVKSSLRSENPDGQ